MGRLAHDWGWENTFVSRVRRTVQRDANHASIIVWSLGNEAGRGRNFDLARQCVLQLDATRPICYESGTLRYVDGRRLWPRSMFLTILSLLFGCRRILGRRCW
jgi:beta-galactosidase/beta-glucuronidase